MKHGALADEFKGVALKALSAVEVDTSLSNQHEFNGAVALKKLFGEGGRRTFNARFFYFGDDEDDSLVEDGFLTWYDAREKHPTRSEHRLYFPDNAVMEQARAGDIIMFAVRPDDSVFVIVADPDGTVWNQLAWLFGAKASSQESFDFLAPRQEISLDYAGRFILEELGIEFELEESGLLDRILARFGDSFPTTADFSAFARGTVEMSPFEEPDATLLAWMEREELLFRELERHMVADRLREGFLRDGVVDTDGFLSFSLSVQNRRKSRAGYALENHMQAVLEAHGIMFQRGAMTENRSKPDFLFPDLAAYQKPDFALGRLTMLGAKSTCKDRWRQVLAEADRIPVKHLLTLEPGISKAQTDEMQSKQLQLVVPIQIHETYHPEQASWLMGVADFLSLLGERQEAA